MPPGRIATILFAVLGILGMGRLAGRLGFRGPGRYLAGLVLLAGPGTALIVGAGSWLALGAAALLPWAVRSVVLHPDDRGRSWLTHIGWALVWTILLIGRLAGAGCRSDHRRGPLAPVGWEPVLTSPRPGHPHGRGRGCGIRVRRPGMAARFRSSAASDHPRLVAGPHRPHRDPLMLIAGRTRRFGLFGALIGLGGMFAVRMPWGDPGIEEAGLVLASFGSALLVAAALDRLSIEPRRLLASMGAAVMILLSAAGLMNGRLGLPAGDINDRFGFASTLAEQGNPGRVLVISADRRVDPG